MQSPGDATRASAGSARGVAFGPTRRSGEVRPEAFERVSGSPVCGRLAQSSHSQDRITLAMRTSGPTTRSAHAFTHFIKADRNAAVPGLVLLGGCDPTYPLIAG